MYLLPSYGRMLWTTDMQILVKQKVLKVKEIQKKLFNVVFIVNSITHIIYNNSYKN